MLNVNSNPNIMARIPIMMDTTPELKIGKIIKINPKIMDNIPDILFGSIFFPPNFVVFTFSSENYKIQKAICFL